MSFEEQNTPSLRITGLGRGHIGHIVAELGQETDLSVQNLRPFGHAACDMYPMLPLTGSPSWQ